MNRSAASFWSWLGRAVPGWGSALRRSVAARILLFVLVLVAVERNAAPWNLGWIRSDEAEEIAERFLLAQEAQVHKYTLIRAVEHRPQGMWRPRGNEERYGAEPAIGYILRYFRPHEQDGWTISVSPIGRIYRVRRQQLDDEPAQRVERKLALDLVRIKLRTELHLAADSLRLVSDSTVSQPQRSDWYFTFTHALPSDTSATLEVKLAGEAITQLSYEGFSPMAGTAPAESPRNRRTIGLALILIGVFLSMHYHRTPLAIRAGVLWAGVLFLLAVAVRALTFSQAVILMPWDSPLTGYLSRVALAGFIESLQAAIVLGMVVATGESLSRDVFRGSTSLSRLAPGLLGWRAAWARAARWALPCAAVVVVYETLASHYLTPLGLAGKVPDMIANALSSPWPYAALPAQIAVSVLWEETVFRLWLIALVIFWMRSPVMAVLLTAATATWFAGYDLSQFMTAGALFYVLWAIIAGWLIVRVGIVSAMLFHALSVGAYATLVMMWTGFGAAIGVTTLSVILLLILVIARDSTPRAQPAPVVVE